ncbi:hypothetical protein STENM223S_00745 [Streptomyces tendae]
MTFPPAPPRPRTDAPPGACARACAYAFAGLRNRRHTPGAPPTRTVRAMAAATPSQGLLNRAPLRTPISCR